MFVIDVVSIGRDIELLLSLLIRIGTMFLFTFIAPIMSLPITLYPREIVINGSWIYDAMSK